ncbi:hypothetical protein PATY110618_00010 [Paenibacillus typhae]|uniref:Uncharacterized protein n=1 Tax=Paenibacillus typhae TaxID=1174501 RepID=A0A1G8HQY2_9BACL|nr:hypothetical protein SAMN05216192_1033 [Paenibacillus typhae]
MFSRESAVLRADCSGLTGRSSPRSWAEATSSCVGLCRLPDVIPDPHSSIMCGTEIVLYSLPLRMCVRHELGWYRERRLAPLGAGGRSFCCVAIPLNPPSEGGPQGLAALWTPATRAPSVEFTVADGEGLLRREERPFLGSPGGDACGAFT